MSSFFCLERLSGARGLSPTLVAKVVLIATVGCNAQGEILTRHSAPHSRPVLPLGSTEGMPARGASSTLRPLTAAAALGRRKSALERHRFMERRRPAALRRIGLLHRSGIGLLHCGA